MKYKLGRSNLAITIFVPYDCYNNCEFCTSKNDYKNSENFSLKKIRESLKLIGNLRNVKDIVITGGEPFADLYQLQLLLNECVKFNKHIYINSTLPVKNSNERESIIEFIKNNKTAINGINVSRHIIWKNKYEDDSMLKEILDIGIPIRINSVLFGYDPDPNKSLITIDKIKKQIDTYAEISSSISFRADYRNIKDMNSLKGFDSFMLLLNDNYTYCHSGGCLVCNDDTFKDENHKNYYIHYHRGKELSSVKLGNDIKIINDIIIKQDGSIHFDWIADETDDIIELLKQWLTVKNEATQNPRKTVVLSCADVRKNKNKILNVLLNNYSQRPKDLTIVSASDYYSDYRPCGSITCGGSC